MLKRAFIFAFAFVLAPAMVAVFMSVAAVSQLMIHKNPAALPAGAPIAVPAPRLDPAKPTAVILLSNSGTELTDFLGPYEILAASGLFNVVTTAPVKMLSQTTGAVAVLPETSFADAPPADLLVLPAVLDPTNPELVRWVRDHAPRAKLVLALCEGARLAAQAGLTEGRRITSHFIAVPDLRRDARAREVLEGVRYVADGKLITTAGVTAALDGAYAAIAHFHGTPAARQAAARLGYAWAEEAEPAVSRPGRMLTAGDYLRFFVNGGFDWNRRRIGVLLYPGVHELDLAASLDTFPRTLTDVTAAVSVRREAIVTRHGLRLVPNDAIAGADVPDLLIVPSGSVGRGQAAPADPLEENTVKGWITGARIPVTSFLTDSPGTAFARNLQALAHLEGGPDAALVAKLVESPWKPEETGFAFPLAIWLRVALLGIGGIAVASLLERRFRRSEIRETSARQA